MAKALQNQILLISQNPRGNVHLYWYEWYCKTTSQVCNWLLDIYLEFELWVKYTALTICPYYIMCLWRCCRGKLSKLRHLFVTCAFGIHGDYKFVMANELVIYCISNTLTFCSCCSSADEKAETIESVDSAWCFTLVEKAYWRRVLHCLWRNVQRQWHNR